MKHIVFDCDNTFGVMNCDVDDGLALIYLLGCEEAIIHGITTTYGNNKLDVVYKNTKAMLSELGREDIVLKRGGCLAGDYDNEASRYLVDMANQYPGELTVLATGSLTNLAGAYEMDPDFFEKLNAIVLMGGITTPLVFEKKTMDELNFSCDSQAAHRVLTYGKNVSVITGNNCLKVLFTKDEYKEKLFQSKEKIASYIVEKTDYWFGYNDEGYGISGFYNWDVVAAVYCMHPELFVDRIENYKIEEKKLRQGFLEKSTVGNVRLNLPEIGDSDAFKNNIYNTWLKVQL